MVADLVPPGQVRKAPAGSFVSHRRRLWFGVKAPRTVRGELEEAKQSTSTPPPSVMLGHFLADGASRKANGPDKYPQGFMAPQMGSRSSASMAAHERPGTSDAEAMRQGSAESDVMHMGLSGARMQQASRTSARQEGERDNSSIGVGDAQPAQSKRTPSTPTRVPPPIAAVLAHLKQGAATQAGRRTPPSPPSPPLAQVEADTEAEAAEAAAALARASEQRRLAEGRYAAARKLKEQDEAAAKARAEASSFAEASKWAELEASASDAVLEPEEQDLTPPEPPPRRSKATSPRALSTEAPDGVARPRARHSRRPRRRMYLDGPRESSEPDSASSYSRDGTEVGHSQADEGRGSTVRINQAMADLAAATDGLDAMVGDVGDEGAVAEIEKLIAATQQLRARAEQAIAKAASGRLPGEPEEPAQKISPPRPPPRASLSRASSSGSCALSTSSNVAPFAARATSPPPDEVPPEPPPRTSPNRSLHGKDRPASAQASTPALATATTFGAAEPSATASTSSRDISPTGTPAKARRDEDGGRVGSRPWTPMSTNSSAEDLVEGRVTPPQALPGPVPAVRRAAAEMAPPPPPRSRAHEKRQACLESALLASTPSGGSPLRKVSSSPSVSLGSVDEDTTVPTSLDLELTLPGPSGDVKVRVAVPLDKLGAGGRRQLGATAAAKLSPSPGLTPNPMPRDTNGYVTVPAVVTIPASIAAPSPAPLANDASPPRSGSVAAAAAAWPPGGSGASSRGSKASSEMSSPGRGRRSSRGRALSGGASLAEFGGVPSLTEVDAPPRRKSFGKPSAKSEGALPSRSTARAKVIAPTAKPPVPNWHHPKGVALAWLEAQPKMSFPRESAGAESRDDQRAASLPATTIRRQQALPPSPSGLRTAPARISEGADGEFEMYAPLGGGGKKTASRSVTGSMLARRRSPPPNGRKGI